MQSFNFGERVPGPNQSIRDWCHARASQIPPKGDIRHQSSTWHRGIPGYAQHLAERGPRGDLHAFMTVRENLARKKRRELCDESKDDNGVDSAQYNSILSLVPQTTSLPNWDLSAAADEAPPMESDVHPLTDLTPSIKDRLLNDPYSLDSRLKSRF